MLALHKIRLTILSGAAIVAMLISGTFAAPVLSQSDTAYPTYIVESGDTLSTIAVKFNTTLRELISVNNIADANAISVGSELLIPSFPGVSGRLAIRSADIGDTIETLGAKYHVSEDALLRMNRLTSREQVYIGLQLYVIDSGTAPANVVIAAETTPDMTALEAVAGSGESLWTLLLANSIGSSWELPAHARFLSVAPADGTDTEQVLKMSVGHLPALQGGTISISVASPLELEVTGSLDEQIIHFSKVDGAYQGLAGINAIEPTGLKALSLKVTQNGELMHETQQYLLVSHGLFALPMHLNVDPASIEPDAIEAERNEVRDVLIAYDPVKHWAGKFNYPVDDACVNAFYGGPRIYNGTYTSYHTGVDFGVCADNLNIYAPANGVVAATGLSPIKGNYTIISHGLGVYSGYLHQAEIMVQPGDQVTPGQQIGVVGNTGRSTGPHLHWEMWVNGKSVDALEWVEQDFP